MTQWTWPIIHGLVASAAVLASLQVTYWIGDYHARRIELRAGRSRL
ncbi:MAG: hypothetical protein ACYCYO_08330 [Bacilli bacterium]